MPRRAAPVLRSWWCCILMTPQVFLKITFPLAGRTELSRKMMMSRLGLPPSDSPKMRRRRKQLNRGRFYVIGGGQPRRCEDGLRQADHVLSPLGANVRLDHRASLVSHGVHRIGRPYELTAEHDRHVAAHAPLSKPLRRKNPSVAGEASHGDGGVRSEASAAMIWGGGASPQGSALIRPARRTVRPRG